MNLQDGLINATYIVDAMHLPLYTERRLEALGLTKGTKVTVLNKKRRGAVIIKFRGTRFAVGGRIARNITVSREVMA